MNDHNCNDDNHSIVDSTAIRSTKWPLNDHRIVLKRSTSADSVLMADSYQLVGSYQTLMAPNYSQRIHRFTQTPEEWEESDKRKIEPKIKENKSESIIINKNSGLKRTDHKLIGNKDQSTQINECDSREWTAQMLVTSSGVSPAKSTKSGPIAIPTKLNVDTSRAGNSVEELNQEIESLVLRGICNYGDQQTCDKIPEGHRAPVVELLLAQRTVKTQTINGMNGVGSSGEESSDLSQPESPIFVAETNSTSDPNEVQNSCSSPKINKFLEREPPDGCEKIKIVAEDYRADYHSSIGSVRPVQPSSSGFVLLPSRSSAFLPIFKTNSFTANDLSADYLQNRINYRKS